MKIGKIGENRKEWNELNGNRYKLRIRLFGLWYDLVEVEFKDEVVINIKICKNDFLYQSFKKRLYDALEEVGVDTVEKMKNAVEREIIDYTRDASDYYAGIADLMEVM